MSYNLQGELCLAASQANSRLILCNCPIMWFFAFVHVKTRCKLEGGEMTRFLRGLTSRVKCDKKKTQGLWIRIRIYFLSWIRTQKGKIEGKN